MRVYAVDPGDMRTAMHQEAFPGEDISDRPDPSAAVPAFRPCGWSALSGRYRAGLGRAARLRCPRERGRLPFRAAVGGRGVVAARGPGLVPRPCSARGRLPERRRPRARPTTSPFTSIPATSGREHQRDGAPRSTSSGTAAPRIILHLARRRLVGRRGPALTSPARPIPSLGEVVRLPGGVGPASSIRTRPASPGSGATLPLPADAPVHYLEEHGHRSATATSTASGRSRSYQNVYADRPGSAEMPSAGRPLTDRSWFG